MTTTTQRRADIVAALGSLVATLLLVVGVPLLLAVLAGWPLPHSLPDPSQIHRALDTGWSPDGTFVLKAIALVAWLAWLQLTTSLVLELVAAIRGKRRARHLWVVGWAQPVAARLAAGLLLLQTLANATPATALPSLPTVHVASTPIVNDPPAGTAAPVANASAAVELPVYEIHRHDTLWDIAERHLGDPLRWREIFALNHDRAQPEGRHLTDPDRIYPGWTLVLPADATNLDMPAVQPPLAPPAPAPHASDSNCAPVGVAPAPPQASPLAPSTTTPAVPTTSPATVVPRKATTAPASDSSRGGRPTPAGPGTNGDAHIAPRRHGLPINDIGLPLLAAGGLIAAVDQARRLRQRRRPAGRRLPKPPASAEPVERKARAVAADQAAEWIDTTLRYLASQLTQRDRSAPQIVGVRAGALGVEILIEPADTTPPAGFHSADDGHVWRLASELELARMQLTSDGMAAPCPTLITLGHTPDGPVLLNLEHAGTLAVDGDPSRSDAFLAGAALELATAPWADTNRVVICGPDGDPLDGLDQVERAVDPPALAADVQRSATATRNELGSRASTLAARVEAAWSDTWEATAIVMPADGVNPEALERIAGAAEPHTTGLTLVTSAVLDNATWRLHIDGNGTATLEPLGLELRSTLDPEAVAGAAALIASATAEPIDEPDGPRADEDVEDANVEGAVEPQAAATGAAELEVHVLGPVEIDGWAQPTTRKKVVEVAAYLATHDRPVPTDTLRCALWPLDEDGHDIAYATFKQAVSRARAALGEDSTGAKHLPDAHDGTYRLGPRATSDWTEFRRLVCAASAAPSSEATELLRQALALVRGAPFADVAPGTFGWAWSEQIVSDIEVAVTDAAEQLAQLALDDGDAAAAAWAARQGLLVVPAHEGLQRIRMRAADLAGDADALDQAFRDAQRAAASVDALDGLSDETIALYRQLAAARSQHASNGERTNASPASHTPQ